MIRDQDDKYPAQTAADIPPSPWDSFFPERPAVSDDFMTERASQDQRGRESL
ncbi:MAG: hypothetical protein WCY98_06110 [Castellaniella sp.]